MLDKDIEKEENTDMIINIGSAGRRSATGNPYLALPDTLGKTSVTTNMWRKVQAKVIAADNGAARPENLTRWIRRTR